MSIDHQRPQLNNVAARLAGHVMALDEARAQELLAEAWPTGEMADARGSIMAGPVEICRGERYAVSRRVAVMPITGVLTADSAALERWFGWATYAGIDQACDELANNEDVSAVVMPVNSPGGMVMGLEGASQAIAALGAVKPVHCYVNPMAASAGYFLASQATDITIAPGAEAGSIGTTRNSIWPVKPDLFGDQWGIHVSSHARAKRPDPTSESGLAEITRSLDVAEAAFLDAVAKGRGIERSELLQRLSVTDDVADGGAMFPAAEAVSRGLADGIENRRAFYDRVFAQYAPAPAKNAPRAMAATARAKAAVAMAKSKY